MTDTDTTTTTFACPDWCDGPDEHDVDDDADGPGTIRHSRGVGDRLDDWARIYVQAVEDRDGIKPPVLYLDCGTVPDLTGAEARQLAAAVLAGAAELDRTTAGPANHEPWCDIQEHRKTARQLYGRDASWTVMACFSAPIDALPGYPDGSQTRAWIVDGGEFTGPHKTDHQVFVDLGLHDLYLGGSNAGALGRVLREASLEQLRTFGAALGQLANLVAEGSA
jgi:hypothetical protein